MALNKNEDPSINYHDRLDLMLHVENYSDQKCGSINPRTRKPEYCCNECPTLKEKIKSE
jgi:hypothetical protein